MIRFLAINIAAAALLIAGAAVYFSERASACRDATGTYHQALGMWSAASTRRQIIEQCPQCAYPTARTHAAIKRQIAAEAAGNDAAAITAAVDKAAAVMRRACGRV